MSQSGSEQENLSSYNIEPLPGLPGPSSKRAQPNDVAPSVDVDFSSSMSQHQTGKLNETRLPSRPRPMNPIYLRRQNALIHGTFVVKPSLQIMPLFQNFVDEMSVDAMHNFQAFADGGAIDVDIWLVDDELLARSGDRALLAKETQASISLNIQNSKDSVVAKLVSRNNRCSSCEISCCRLL
jgi:hypothetical protein